MGKRYIINENDEYLKVLEVLNKLAAENKYVFRGYEKQDHLYPQINREKNFELYEGELLKEFELYGSNYFNSRTAIDFMSYAQHFGIPTRLLDFTYNPFIALSFALYSKKYSHTYKNEEDNKYYYVRYASISDNIFLETLPLYEGKPKEQQLQTESLCVKSLLSRNVIEDVFGKNEIGNSMDSFFSAMKPFSGNKEKSDTNNKIKQRAILFVSPNQSNQRIIMQQGLFMFPYTLNKTKHISIIENNSSVIMIHSKHRPDLRRYLDTLGYNTFRLMPDLTSICSAIKRRCIDE